MPREPRKIADVFSENVHRNIEEVIKVDALDDEVVLEEIREYYPTPSIQQQMAEVLKAYDGVRQGPTNKVGVWVSGFFGAGKSSFAKLLGILLESRNVAGQNAIDLFAKRVTSNEIKVFLQQIREHAPTIAIVFDILKDQIQSARDNPVTLVMYKALLRALGYPQDIDLAELEINLEERGELDAFKTRYAQLFDGRSWDDGKRLVMTAVAEASRTLHELDPRTYPAIDYWARTRPRVDLSPKLLAERVLQLSQARAGGRHVVFVIDEVGQYVARDLGRIGDLQGVVESLALLGKGRIWLIATSQEKLDQILDIYEKDRSDLVRLQDRFAHKVFLKPSDIREVASHRVLAKTAAAETVLRKQFQDHRGRLTEATRLTAAVQLPGLEEDSFVSLYPLLPYQVDLLIDVVSGLRRQSGGPQTMGGANRTIIKLAQQLVTHPKVGLANEAIGRLVTFDGVYELISTNVSTEIQQEIDEIAHQIPHPFAASVAKALALLQFAEAVHTTEENLAAVLHPGVSETSVLPQVREVVEKLVDARKVRRTEHGLKIQSAAERTWDQERDSRRPTAGHRAKIVKEVLEQIWGKGAQAPNQQLGGWKRFTAGLRVGSEMLVDGDVMFEVQLLDPARPRDEQLHEVRSRTQRDDALVAWAIEMSDAAERHIVEHYRSEQMLSRPIRSTEEVLQRDERRRLADAVRDLTTELRKALCHGRVYFQGNDRSCADEADDPKAEARRVLGGALNAIFHRFDDWDVRVTPKDVEAILRSESVTGLPSCYAALRLVQTVDGQARLVTDHGAAREILDWVRLRCDSGQAPSGKELEQHFASAPYGGDFDLVRLLVATLLRSGQVTLTAQGQQIKNALTPEAQKEITNNPHFRALTVRVRETTLDPKKVRAAAQMLEQRFGHKVPALTAESVAGVLRDKLCSESHTVEGALDHLREHQLPGQDTLTKAVGALRVIRDGDGEEAINAFLDNADTLATAIPRARAMDQIFTGGAGEDLRRARVAIRKVGRAIEEELDEDGPAHQALSRLRDQLAKETFYESVSAISNDATAVLEHFDEIHHQVFAQRRDAYARALEVLQQAPGWSQLSPPEQDQITGPIRVRAQAEPEAEAWRNGGELISLLREQTRAAPALLETALAALRRAVTPEAIEIRVRDLLGGPIATAEELESAIKAIREAVEKAIADGHPVVLI